MSQVLPTPITDSGESVGVPPVCLRLDESFDRVVALNPEWRIEQNANGEMVFMSPTGGESGRQNSKLGFQLELWASQFGGECFDSSTLFLLPNRAMRSPDVSWIDSKRWNKLTKRQREGYPPICPDFVVELRSQTDRLVDLQAKMVEYIENGVRLGLLIDPITKTVYFYRPGKPVEVAQDPKSVIAGEEMPGLIIDLIRIWPDLAASETEA